MTERGKHTTCPNCGNEHAHGWSYEEDVICESCEAWKEAEAQYGKEIEQLRAELEVERSRNGLLLGELDELRGSMRELLERMNSIFKQPLGGRAGGEQG